MLSGRKEVRLNSVTRDQIDMHYCDVSQRNDTNHNLYKRTYGLFRWKCFFLSFSTLMNCTHIHSSFTHKICNVQFLIVFVFNDSSSKKNNRIQRTKAIYISRVKCSFLFWSQTHCFVKWPAPIHMSTRLYLKVFKRIHDTTGTDNHHIKWK